MISKKLLAAIVECLATPLNSDYVDYRFESKSNEDYVLYFSSNVVPVDELEVVVQTAFAYLAQRSWLQFTLDKTQDAIRVRIHIFGRCMRESKLERICDCLSFPLVKLTNKSFLEKALNKEYDNGNNYACRKLSHDVRSTVWEIWHGDRGAFIQ